MSSIGSNRQLPIKKLHRLENKHFIVIDKSITEKLNYLGENICDLYFQQELIEDDVIVLRRFHVRNFAVNED